MNDLLMRPRSEHQLLVIETIKSYIGEPGAEVVRSLYDDNKTTITRDEVVPFAEKHGLEETQVFFVLELMVSSGIWSRVVVNKANGERLMMMRLMKRLCAASSTQVWKSILAQTKLGWADLEGTL